MYQRIENRFYDYIYILTSINSIICNLSVPVDKTMKSVRTRKSVPIVLSFINFWLLYVLYFDVENGVLQIVIEKVMKHGITKTWTDWKVTTFYKFVISTWNWNWNYFIISFKPKKKKIK